MENNNIINTNKNIKNLIKLYTENNNKDKEKNLKKIENIKKKEIKDYSIKLSNLAKLSVISDINLINNKLLENNIKYILTNDNINNNFIECYEN